VALFSTGYRSQGRSCEHGPYFIRVRNAAGKYQWVKHETEAAAKEAAKLAPLAQKAQELGLTVDEATNTANASRTSIKTAIENYLHERRFGRPRSIKVYENVFDQLLTNLRCGIKFVDQLATARRDIVSTDNRSDICPGAATARSSTRIGPGDDASAASTNTASAATAFTSARSQQPPPPAYSPVQLDQMVSPIALYPDPLLAQIFAAATYPDQIPDAARWADQHHYLTGQALADAIQADQLPWDPSVQALLPFPTVLQMMASDMPRTSAIGNAFLAQQQDVMDAVQMERRKAYQ
jgi:uncharacterized protein DUF3300